MDGIPQIEQYQGLSFSEASAKEKNSLISNLISALNGDEYKEAKEIMEQIKATGDKELIAKADYINSVL